MNFNRGVGQYVRNRRGATAVVFALILVPLLLVVGLAVDIGMYQKQKMKVQHALDMASLAAARHLSKDLSADTADVQAIANAFFAAEIELENYVSMNDVSVERSGMRLNVGVDGTMPTSFMQLAGIDTMSLATNSEVVYGVPSMVEIALVLDTSTSMDQTDTGESLSRVESLKAAAKDMVTILFDPASTLNVEMAIVPFSNRVNIGTDQSGEAWLSVPADESEDRTDCYITPEWYEANCVRDSTTCSDDDVVGSCGTWNCTGVDTSSADRDCTTVTSTRSWHGCVEPRSTANHLKDGLYVSEQIPGYLSTHERQCASPVLPLTDNVSDLNLTLTTMKVRSETYIPSGLIWGLRMLSKDAPFATDKSVSDFMAEGGVKSIILMSDGANTLAPDATGEIGDLDISSADPNTRAICQTIKDAGVEIYVVAYNIADVSTTTLLQDCASSESRFFSAGSADELKGVFESIAKQVVRDISIVG